MKSNIETYLGKSILKNEEIEIKFQPSSKEQRITECLCHFKIIFEDKEKNKYHQIANGGYKGGIKFSNPEEVTTP